MAHVAALYRYPVKGFTPEECETLMVLDDHFSIWVDDIDTVKRAIEPHGGKYHSGPIAHAPESAEHKSRDAYGIVFDISTHGWDGEAVSFDRRLNCCHNSLLRAARKKRWTWD
jgi:hypothetical protein